MHLAWRRGLASDYAPTMADMLTLCTEADDAEALLARAVEGN